MAMPAINKLLILISILLVMILTQLLILNYNVLIKKISYIPMDLYEPDNEDYAEEKYYAKQESLIADFEELKNDTIPIPHEIIRSIITELEGFNWNEEFQEEDLSIIYHKTVFAKYFPSDHTPDRKFIVVTSSNHIGDFVQAEEDVLSVFEFKEKNRLWDMTHKHLAFGYSNEYGPEPFRCELARIGYNNRYALIEYTGYSGNGGHELQSRLVYSFVGEEIKLVFDFTAYEYYFDYPQDIEYTEGYSDMRIIESNKDWFDIETKSEDSDWNDRTPGVVIHFVFNGEEYVENKRQIHISAN